ncbi:MAG: hypothetical protein JWM02_2857 [Frankiales bacterium]|nr:hypothetical protein [Frankiales bacterium]
MGSEAVRAALSPKVRDALRQAFAAEVAARLPRLALLEGPASASDLDAARRDAHTLGSSAWVVEEPEISRLARAVEEQLQDGPVPELLALLRAWGP